MDTAIPTLRSPVVKLCPGNVLLEDSAPAALPELEEVFELFLIKVPCLLVLSLHDTATNPILEDLHERGGAKSVITGEWG